MSERAIPPEWESERELVELVRDLGRRGLTAGLDESFVTGRPVEGAIELMVESGVFALRASRS